MLFINFKRKGQRKFLVLVKQKSGLTWKKLAKRINRSRSTILAYLREDCKIPKPVFDILNEYVNFKDFEIVEIVNVRKYVSVPNLSDKLSEFLGILSGDGHLHNYPAELSITCHAYSDRDYIENYVKNVFKDLFDKDPKIIFQNNVIKLRYYSKDLVNKLNKIYGFPIGKKKNRLHIPKKILRNKPYLINYLRGLFDTDGNFNRHHKNTAMIEITSRDNPFLDELFIAFKKLNFKISKGYKSVRIYEKREIHRFFDEIKPNNPKNILKYKIFKKTNEVPLTKDL